MISSTAMHDCFYEHILPILFSINTNYTLIMYKMIDKKTYEKLYNLLRDFLVSFRSGEGDYPHKPNTTNIAFAIDRERLIHDIFRPRMAGKRMKSKTNKLTVVIGDYKRSITLIRIQTIRGIIDDNSMSFDLRIKCLQLHHDPWKIILSKYCPVLLEALDRELCNLRELVISEETREILMLYFDRLVGLWLEREFVGYGCHAFHSLIRDDPILQQKTLIILETLLHDESVEIKRVYDLSVECVKIDPVATMRILRMKFFFCPCLRQQMTTSAFKSRSKHLNQHEHRYLSLIKGKLWNRKGMCFRIRNANLQEKTQLFIEHVNKIRKAANL